MIRKFVEIRDKGTCIPAIAIQMLGDNEIQRHYLRRAGYPADGSSIMLMVVDDGKATNDPYEWAVKLAMGSRTMPVAHNWILDHFGEITEGDVIDVEFILGESTTCKISERFK
jgi:hypothetical protein